MAERIVELHMVVHVDKDWHEARKLSLDGDDKRAKWIPRSLTKSFHLIGKKTSATDAFGARVILPIAHITLPEWKARQDGLI